MSGSAPPVGLEGGLCSFRVTGPPTVSPLHGLLCVPSRVGNIGVMTSVRRCAMGKKLDLVKLYPDLFVGMDGETIEGITAAFANNWLEGWKPNRADVADAVAWEKGEIDDAEYDRRSTQRAAEVSAAVTKRRGLLR